MEVAAYAIHACG